MFRELARDLPTDPTPSPGVGCILATDLGALDTLLARAARLALALLHTPVRQFREALAQHRPDHTEVERLSRQRLGQDLFRTALLDYWDGACAVTGLAVPALLRASHIRPWTQCENDEQRLWAPAYQSTTGWRGAGAPRPRLWAPTTALGGGGARGLSRLPSSRGVAALNIPR